MNEEWRKIEGYNGKYLVSNMGRVKSFMGRKPRILRPRDNGRYLSVQLFKNGSRSTKTIHRLVAKAFVSNPENKPEVNHINGDRKDNKSINLSWVTHMENCQHAAKNDLLNVPKGSEQHMSKLTEEDVIKMRRIYDETNRTKSSIAKEFDISSSCACNILNYKSWKHV